MCKTKYIAEKDLRWPYITINDLWGHTCVLIILGIIEMFIKISSYMNVLEIKKNQIPESWNSGMTEFFFET